MNALDAMLARLEKVRDSRNGSYIACCPAHADKSPSLSIRETPDGRVLVHCFAGCTVQDVVAAVGLRIEDLFPEKLPERTRPERQRFLPSDLLRVIGFEASVVSIAAYRLVDQKIPLTPTDVSRLQLAVERINAALEAGNVHVK